MNRKIPGTTRNFTAVWNFTAVQDAIRNVMVDNFLSLVAHHGAPGPWGPIHCPGNLRIDRFAQLVPVVRPTVMIGVSGRWDPAFYYYGCCLLLMNNVKWNNVK